MVRTSRTLAIDARPRGARGPLAAERVLGRTVLDHLLDTVSAVSSDHGPVTIHVIPDEPLSPTAAIAEKLGQDCVVTDRSPDASAVILRTDRLYDPARLRRALRTGHDPESAVIWRLDTPGTLAAAGEELKRRQSYQPIGRYWALGPARRLARVLALTRVRPNGVTLTAAALMLVAANLVAFAPMGLAANLTAASALALALVLDTTDGHLARLQGTASAFGRWLDAWLDELCDMALHAAIAWSAFQRAGVAAWLLTGMLYAMGKYVFLVGETEVAHECAGDETAELAPERSIMHDAFRLAGHADVRWHLWIVLAAAGRLDVALVAYAVYYPLRTLLSAARKVVRLA